MGRITIEKPNAGIGACIRQRSTVTCSERGAALLLVMWVGTLFSLVLTGFAFSMRVESDAARNFQDHARAMLLAESGITEAMAELVNVRQGRNPNAGGFRPIRIGPRRLGTGTYQVLITNEEGKISLNHASETVLRRLLEQSGVKDASLQETIAASILDWRDSDDVERVGGAESEFYQSGSRPYTAKNGPFARVEELLAVRGMTPEILYGNIIDRSRKQLLQRTPPENREFVAGEYLGIRPYLTTRGSGRIDYATAEVDVLFASALPADRVRVLLEAREREQSAGGSSQMTVSAVGSGSHPRIYRIESIGRVEGSPLATEIHAIVTREGTMRAPRFRVLAWEEIGSNGL